MIHFTKSFFGKILLKLKPDNRFFLFLFFLLVSSISWLLNMLSKEYPYVIFYPITYANGASSNFLIEKPPSSLTLKINATGFNILEYNFRKEKNPLEININSLELMRLVGKRKSLHYVLSNTERATLGKQLPNIKINSIMPDTLLFVFAKIEHKKVKVIPDLHITYKQQYTLKNKIRVIPDSITIFGTREALDSVQSISSFPLYFNDVSKSITHKCKLEEIKAIRCSKNDVKISIPVEKFTEVKMSVPIETINVPDGISLKIFPNTINISYLVILSQYDNIKPSMFHFVVDYNDLENGMVQKLRIHLKSSPVTILSNSLKYSPTKVDYILEK